MDNILSNAKISDVTQLNLSHDLDLRCFMCNEKRSELRIKYAVPCNCGVTADVYECLCNDCGKKRMSA